MLPFLQQIYGSGTKPLRFPEIHCFSPEILNKITAKICNNFFWIGNDPPPLFINFIKETVETKGGTGAGAGDANTSSNCVVIDGRIVVQCA